MLDVCLLGTGGTVPLKTRWLSSAILRYNGRSILMDCGEGTQIALKMSGFTFKSIDVICITHFHADHISGLPGFLLTMGNEGRCENVTIIGPVGTKKVVDSLSIITPGLMFDIDVLEVSNDDERFYFDEYDIVAFKVKHRINCLGFSVNIQRPGKFDVDKAKLNNVPMKIWSNLQRENDVIYEGIKYTQDMVLGPERKGIKVVYSTDTRPCDNLVLNSRDADLLILEGMYATSDKDQMAKEKMHMTFKEAGMIAKKCNAKRLWLTHFSPSLPEPQMYADDVISVFNNTEIGYDSKKDTIKF